MITKVTYVIRIKTILPRCAQIERNAQRSHSYNNFRHSLVGVL